MKNFKYPFLIPRPAKLSYEINRLQEIEKSGWFSNFGPKICEFEKNVIENLFDGRGHCLTSVNGTLGLIIAIRYVLDKSKKTVQKKSSATKRIYAILPSFTFAATAQAAIWNGLTPLFCDIDASTWLPSRHSIESLLKKYKDKVAVIIPYATFGNNLPVRDYEALEEIYGVPVVFDAASSIGSRTADDRHFGYGTHIPVVFSLHATKTFSTAEGGLIYCDDREAIASMKRMSNFGFGQEHETIGPGLNNKMSEISALLALAKLETFQAIVSHRQNMAGTYWKILRDYNFQFQEIIGDKPAYQFFPAALPKELCHSSIRSSVIEQMNKSGIEIRGYFVPPLHEHLYFSDCPTDNLKNTIKISTGVLSFPLHDYIQKKNIVDICQTLTDICKGISKETKKNKKHAA